MITNFSPRLAPFEVNTVGRRDYLVKLDDAQDSRRRLTFYVAGGIPFQTTVPIGTYVLKYADGDHWCGPLKLFGGDVVQKSRTDLVFDYASDGSVSGQTVTLYPVLNGNFATTEVPANQF